MMLEFNVPQQKEPNTANLQFKVMEAVNTPAENLASEFYLRLVKMIEEFDVALDHTQAVGVKLVSFGQAMTFHVTHLGYSDPSLIIFGGVMNDGSPVQLIQHVSQINFLLTTIKRLNPEEPKKPIGFINK